MMDAASEAETLRIVDKFFEALNAGDVPACVSLFTEDGVMWRNTTMIDLPKEQSLAPLTALAGRLHYDVTRRYVVHDGCIVQFVVRSTKPGAPDVVVPHLHRIVLDKDKIARVDIYFDSAQAGAFMEANSA